MESKYIFGIDLGTTYSVISYLDENLLIQTCSNEDGDMITPSVVDLSDVNPTVGQVAKDNKVFYPHSVLDFFKREMGNGHATIYYGENFDKETTAIDLSAEVLRYLARYASDATDSSIEMVVITVPAYFGPEEKQSTKEAAEKAGFKDVFLIEEPTAAAVYYGYKGDKNETVLVYDLGGGTFDVVPLLLICGTYLVFVRIDSHWLLIHQSSSFRTIFASNGDKIPPCGVPFVGYVFEPSGITIGAFSICLITQISFLSCIPIAQT